VGSGSVKFWVGPEGVDNQPQKSMVGVTLVPKRWLVTHEGGAFAGFV
jgi:hypothetical protein